MQVANQLLIETEYRAAKNGCAVVDSSTRGRLKITGGTRIDFLHRMSTNDLLSLQAGQGAATIFLTPIGRMIDRTIVYVRENDLIMLTSRGAQSRVMAWLKKYIFFNDDVQIEDATDADGMLSLYGSKSNDLIQSLTGAALEELPLHHCRSVEVKGIEVLIARADSIGLSGFHMIVESAILSELQSILIESGATSIGENTYQILRVEAGLPEFEHELTDDTIPLEANLWNDVSFTKGCYTGQEIIARMESRQRLAKQLIGLRFAAEISLPARIIFERSEAGNVTSVVHSPDRGWLGLGYIKPALALEDQSVTVQAAERSIDAHLSLLPFKF